MTAGAAAPTIGRIVVYRSRTGKYVVPAIVSATQDTLFRLGVEEGNLPDLTDDSHVHLIVFTPGIAGRRNSTTSEEQLAQLTARGAPAGGTYAEWDVPYDETGETPGSWSWPRIGPPMHRDAHMGLMREITDAMHMRGRP